MRKTFKTLIVALPLAAASLLAQAADSPVGRWKTIDDETGKPKSVVQIEQAANGTLSGKVVEILQSNHGPNPTCDKCDGALKGKPIKGMTILWGLKPDGTAVWGGGSVLGFDMAKQCPGWTAHAQRMARRPAVQRAFEREGLVLPATT